MFVFAQKWYKALPVSVSDTVNEWGADTHDAPLALHNRSAANMLVSLEILDGDGEDAGERIIKILVGDTFDFPGKRRVCRVNATNTTGGGSSTLAYETIKTTAAGAAFTNQPANDGVEIVSSNAADTTQSATVYGTTQGTETVVVETVALNGTTAVPTVKVDWGLILGVSLSASCAGTVTFREASANQTITTITTGVLSKGIETVSPAANAFNLKPTFVASGATTKVIGLDGLAPDDTTARRDAQDINGATPVAANLTFGQITKVLTGDLESSVTVTVSVSADLVAIY